MGMGKGSEKESKIELPPEIKKAALANLKLADEVGRLPYVPNFGMQFAAFTPQQEAAFAGTQKAASAFGMPTAAGTGMPKPMNVGGYSGYSTQPLYEDSMSRVDPGVLELYNSFFYPNDKKGGGGGDTKKDSGGSGTSWKGGRPSNSERGSYFAATGQNDMPGGSKFS